MLLVAKLPGLLWEGEVTWRLGALSFEMEGYAAILLQDLRSFR